MIWPLIAGGASLGAGVLSLGVFHPRVALFGPQLSKGPARPGQLTLSFDDGPHPVHTPAIAAKLKRHHFKATFFCVGSQAERYPEVIRDLLADGHEVANHTYSHDTARHLFSAPLLTEDLKRCQSVLGGLGPSPAWYRPAVGIRNPPVFQAARAVGLKVVTWSLAARDGGFPFSSEKAAALAEQADAGDVIALHDGERGKNAAFRAETVTHLDRLLDRLAERGLKSITLSQLTEGQGG